MDTIDIPRNTFSPPLYVHIHNRTYVCTQSSRHWLNDIKHVYSWYTAGAHYNYAFIQIYISTCP